MAINKLPEFAKDGQKNTDDLNLTDGFPVSKKPARQWFNYLFNMLSLKINEIIESDPVTRSEIIDNLTTNDATKPLSAKQGKDLQDNKLGKSENAASATDCSRQVIAGNGLSGGGVLTANRTLTLGTPTKITSSSTNSVTTTSHTHEIDKASTSVAGVVQLNNTLTSASTAEALTAAQGKVLLEMFASSHTQNGYQKIANPLDPSKPLIIQWGKPGVINSGTTINFPIAFPSQVFIVIASDYQGNAVIGTSDWTLKNFKSRSGVPIAYNWFAVGF